MTLKRNNTHPTVCNFGVDIKKQWRGSFIFVEMTDKPGKEEVAKVTRQNLLGQSVTINDLRDREFNGHPITEKEMLALQRFDDFRLRELNRQQSEKEFHNKYIRLQVMANLSPWTEFLKEAYN